MKKIFYWIFTIFQVIFLITACGIQFFSMKKMGMMRYVVYINRTWEAKYPVPALQYAAIAFLVLFCIIILLYVKIKKDIYIDKKALSMLIMEVIITLVFAIFTLVYSTESYRSYYFISLILGIIALIQNIKILVYLKR
ncbi:hypothetical protein [Clostridium magnum]|nr:hypothetical protein [Clostridium magnum]